MSFVLFLLLSPLLRPHILPTSVSWKDYIFKEEGADSVNWLCALLEAVRTKLLYQLYILLLIFIPFIIEIDIIWDHKNLMTSDVDEHKQ